MGLSRLLDATLMACAVLAGAIFVAITVAVPLDALGRSFLARSMFGINDMVEYGLMAAVLLAAPWVLSRGEHVTVDVIAVMIQGRAGRLLSALVSLLGFLVSLIILWYAAQALASAYTSGRMVRKVLVFPQYWTFIPLCICFALTSCEFLRQLIRGRILSAGLSI